jgi:transglutaminase-like putative cysteine protease
MGMGGGTSAALAGVGAIAVLAPAPPVPAGAWPWLHGLVLGTTGVMAIYEMPLPAFALLSTWLMVYQSWTTATADSVRTSILLSTLLLLLGCVQTESPWLGPIFLAYTVLLPVVLLRALLADVEAPAPRWLEVGTAGLSGMSAIVLFSALPRLDVGYIGGHSARMRFPDAVTLGADGLMSDDLSEVMRLKVTTREGRPIVGPLHVRGRALDSFDGVRWTSTLDNPPPHRDDWNRRAEVALQPLEGDVVFGVGELFGADGLIAPQRDGNGGLFHRNPRQALKYVAYGRVSDLTTIGEGRKEWLQLPNDLDPRVVTLAWSIEGENPDNAKVARSLAQYLARTYEYMEHPPAPKGDPLAWFLFDGRKGHCEYFASALAVMLRVRGIPSRLATGFYTEELGDDFTYVVRREHAHAWVEVATPDGWATLDPTPATAATSTTEPKWSLGQALLGVWYARVVDYDLQGQLQAYGALGRPFMGTGGGPDGAGIAGMVVAMGILFAGLGVLRLVLLVGFAGSRNGRTRPDALARLMRDARTIVRQRGWALPEELPPVAAADWLEERAGEPAAPLRELAWIVYGERYGTPADGALTRARDCLRRLRTLPRPRDRGRAARQEGGWRRG